MWKHTSSRVLIKRKTRYLLINFKYRKRTNTKSLGNRKFEIEVKKKIFSGKINEIKINHKICLHNN